MGAPKVTVLYHYFHPDDVVSARHFTDLCEDLVARGWDVEAMPCNRGCRDESKTYLPTEEYRGIRIERVWRPRFRQATTEGRVLNAAWMVAAWCRIGLRPSADAPDVVLVGTDPPLSVGVAAVLKRLRPSIKVAHWCFDMFPEAPIAEGMLREGSLPVKVAKRMFAAGYRACDLIADLGSCMRARIDEYGASARQVTLVPWALVEPATLPQADLAARRELFGDAALGLLYSGNFARGHSFDGLLALARRLRGDERIRFCFGVRGNRAAELRAAVHADDRNVSFAGFAPEDALEKRLAAADVHLASLRDETWAGIIVPSKFFGSLASGRPVIFAGPRRSAIAEWIEEHRVGWVLDASSLDDVAADLAALATSKERLAALQERCFDVYRAHFSRQRVMSSWDRELRMLIGRSAPQPQVGVTSLGVNGSAPHR